jgi:hypothetical protein
VSDKHLRCYSSSRDGSSRSCHIVCCSTRFAVSGWTLDRCGLQGHPLARGRPLVPRPAAAQASSPQRRHARSCRTKPCSSSRLSCCSGPGADYSVTLNVALFWGTCRLLYSVCHAVQGSFVCCFPGKTKQFNTPLFSRFSSHMEYYKFQSALLL